MAITRRPSGRKTRMWTPVGGTRRANTDLRAQWRRGREGEGGVGRRRWGGGRGGVDQML